MTQSNRERETLERARNDLEALDQALRDGEWSGRAGAEQVARTRALPAVREQGRDELQEMQNGTQVKRQPAESTGELVYACIVRLVIH